MHLVGLARWDRTWRGQVCGKISGLLSKHWIEQEVIIVRQAFDVDHEITEYEPSASSSATLGPEPWFKPDFWSGSAQFGPWFSFNQATFSLLEYLISTLLLSNYDMLSLKLSYCRISRDVLSNSYASDVCTCAMMTRVPHPSTLVLME
ncbi:uncharacterized protein HD556DRAFT_1310209 [Suillus plorans]|uniref:Uncharacterized protein n=1 Tax=Suillus plorans TaxID=116603 RepID=A0A9P7AJN5_9AGAM|nr:uncharacterized protein HD556DRAFT_1310209 [Suillus plorans]KAG1790869.1 hypothetical protein HD556DRAFT_1310209 [Suillus plorans]